MFKKLILGVSSILVLLSLLVVPAFAKGGFDEFGYNNTARVFVGTGWSWCQAYAEKNGISGLTTTMCEDWLGGLFSNDKLVMKWNAQWDNCNAIGNDDVNACLGAWTSNEWHGNTPNGSGAVWHYKIIWVGQGADQSPYWLPGGYSIWGNYEVVMDQGVDKTGDAYPSCFNDNELNNGGHAICTLTTPNGYGAVFAH